MNQKYIAIAAVAVAIFFASRHAILNSLAGALVCAQPPQKSDLILVLGGDFYGPRVIKGADLAVQGFAPTVLLSGPPYRDRPEGDFAKEFLESRGYPSRLLSVYGHTARSTIDEAIAVCPELRRRHVRQAILVTSAYHSRRAALVMRLFCPGVKFISVPATDSHYDPTQWRSNPESRRLFTSEWKKIVGTIVYAYPRHVLESIFPLGDR